MRMSRRPISTSTEASSSISAGEPPRAAATRNMQKLPPLEPVDGQTGPCQQAAQIVDARELAHGVEAAVEDAVAGLKLGEQPPEGLGRRLRLRWQVLRLRLR